MAVDNKRQTPASKQAASGPPVAPPGSRPQAGSAKRDELRLLINSRHPIITVESTEEERLKELLAMIAAELKIPLFTWTVINGLSKLGGAPIYATEQPEQALANIALIEGDAIFLLKDFARYCENDRISRRLRQLADRFKVSRRSLIISAASVKLPAELDGDSAPFPLGLPTAEELLPGVKRVLAETGRRAAPDPASALQLARNLVGLTEEEGMRTLRKCLLSCGNGDQRLLDAVLEAKRGALQTDGLLEPIRGGASFADVAGLARLREWVRKRRSALTPEGRRFGLVPPKGVLITGVQGCGKSLAARAVAGEWGVELARLDVGALYDKYIGESEKRLRNTLELAHKLAPIVLWIDEIEKAFASSRTPGESDGGLSQRLLGTFLTWMQERSGDVFLAATSNNITTLPPEMVRKGRFDEIFFVDLPGTDVRKALFELHLKKRGRDAAAFDVAALTEATQGFSGAEIEQAIVAGLYTAFDDEKQHLTTDILLREIRGTQPLSVTRAEEIQAIRDWAKTRAVPAD